MTDSLDAIARAIHARLTGDPRLWAVVDEGERMLYRLAAFDAREVSQRQPIAENEIAAILAGVKKQVDWNGWEEPYVTDRFKAELTKISQQLREPAKPRRARGHSKSTA